MDTQFWLNIIETVLTAIIVPLFAWGVKSLIDWLNTKIHNETIEKYITFAGDIVTQAVKETTQTYVDSLKKTGAFDEIAQREAFNRAKETALKMLTKDAIEAIEMVYGDVNTWLRSKIESAVNDNKA